MTPAKDCYDGGSCRNEALVEELEARIAALEADNARLRTQLEEAVTAATNGFGLITYLAQPAANHPEEASE